MHGGDDGIRGKKEGWVNMANSAGNACGGEGRGRQDQIIALSFPAEMGHVGLLFYAPSENKVRGAKRNPSDRERNASFYKSVA